MISLIGIDCATRPEKVGLAIGKLHKCGVFIEECCTGTRNNLPVQIVAKWLGQSDRALIALDAPLGWPRTLADRLPRHRAGLAMHAQSNELFRRITDDYIRFRMGKRPLEVGANLISRTAVAALEMLDAIRTLTNSPIPLAWHCNEEARYRAIEVYPAATRIAHGALDAAGSLVGLDAVLYFSQAVSISQTSKHGIDAAVCALGGADFLEGRAIPPQDFEIAKIEGWIWAA